MIEDEIHTEDITEDSTEPEDDGFGPRVPAQGARDVEAVLAGGTRVVGVCRRGRYVDGTVIASTTVFGMTTYTVKVGRESIREITRDRIVHVEAPPLPRPVALSGFPAQRSGNQRGTRPPRLSYGGTARRRIA